MLVTCASQWHLQSVNYVNTSYISYLDKVCPKMPLDATLRIIYNSEYMRNVDYRPTRTWFEAQADAVNIVFQQKLIRLRNVHCRNNDNEGKGVCELFFQIVIIYAMALIYFFYEQSGGSCYSYEGSGSNHPQWQCSYCCWQDLRTYRHPYCYRCFTTCSQESREQEPSSTHHRICWFTPGCTGNGWVVNGTGGKEPKKNNVEMG